MLSWIHDYSHMMMQYAWAPLLWACEYGHVGVIDYLLEHGASVHIECVSH